MRYESFISINNLNLAWRRITTAMNPQYKRFFRDIYLGYENGLEDNLKLLHQRLKGGWKASPPIREYLPKPSGFQRPISLLKIEDQIVYQAIANVFAKKLRHRRINVEGKVAFSNLLESPENSTFFLKDWRSSYQAFTKKIELYYKQELRWVAHFDLAAFYETISHELLIKMASPRGGQKETWVKIQKWLKEWSASIPSTPYHHGIPQGPIASDFLAECLLLPLDEEMLKDDISYLRYVDDIRIFGRSKLELRKIIIKIERWCKSFGLIPHGDKYSIKEARSLNDAFGALPSLKPESGRREKYFLTKEAERLFKTTLGGRPLEIRDKSRAKYVLFRSGKSPKLLDWSLRLLSRHPEQINAFVSFFANYEKSIKLENGLMAVFMKGCLTTMCAANYGMYWRE